MIHKVAGVLIALACTSMTFGQSAQTTANSIIGRTQSLIKQGATTTQNVVKQSVTTGQNVIRSQASTIQKPVNSQLPSYGQTNIQPSYRNAIVPANQSYSQNSINQNSINQSTIQSQQQIYNQNSQLQPTATTTPHEPNAVNRTVTQQNPQEFQNAQEFPVQNFQPQQFQQQQYYYNSGNNWNRTQFQPVRRVWNFTRNIIGG